MIVAFTGKAGAGKDTAAKVLSRILAEEYKASVTHYKLTAPIKSFVRQVFGWTEDHIEGDLKETLNSKGFSPRVAMQRLGTEWGRHLDKDIWVNYLLRKIQAEHGEFIHRDSPVWCKQKNFQLLSDLRFKNEAEAVLASGGILVFIDGGGLSGNNTTSSHSSELEVNFLRDLADLQIDNSAKDLNSFEFSLKTLIKSIPLLSSRKFNDFNSWKGLED